VGRTPSSRSSRPVARADGGWFVCEFHTTLVAAEVNGLRELAGGEPDMQQLASRGISLWALLALASCPSLVGVDEVLKPALARGDAKGDLLWYDARYLDVEGKAWPDTKSFYDRLPARAEKMVRAAVWDLSRHSAGLCLRFTTDATALHARWTLTSDRLALPHMPATGVSGLDLYVETRPGKWRWLAVGRPAESPVSTARLVDGLPPGTRNYLLYLPLYNGVRSLEVGVARSSRLIRPAPRSGEAGKPLVFYGTSITQGGCASRPGMVHTAILGRRLGRPVINLGFSGNGRMEPELAKLLAELDPAVYVLDCLPNMTAKDVAERVEPFVRTLRKARPHTPILLVEDRFYANAPLLPALRRHNEQNHAALRKTYERLVKEDCKGLHYLSGEQLLGEDGEATVDGSHPTDLGFVRQADAFEAVLRPLLQKGSKAK